MIVERPTSSLTADASSAYRVDGEATAIISRIRTNLRITLLLAHNFLCAFVSADDLDRRRRRLHLGDDGLIRCHRPWTSALHRGTRRRAESEQRGRADAARHRHGLVERVPERELNLAFRGRQCETLGL